MKPQIAIETVRDAVAERIVVATLLTDCTDQALQWYNEAG